MPTESLRLTCCHEGCPDKAASVTVNVFGKAFPQCLRHESAQGRIAQRNTTASLTVPYEAAALIGKPCLVGGSSSVIVSLEELAVLQVMTC